MSRGYTLQALQAELRTTANSERRKEIEEAIARIREAERTQPAAV